MKKDNCAHPELIQLPRVVLCRRCGGCWCPDDGRYQWLICCEKMRDFASIGPRSAKIETDGGYPPHPSERYPVILVGSEGRWPVPIQYCPFCGRAIEPKGAPVGGKATSAGQQGVERQGE